MSAKAIASLGLAGIVVVGLTACESTQDKSARLEAAGKEVLNEKGLEISKGEIAENVEVVDTAVLYDQNGAAVVVTLRNKSAQDLAAVPISIDVKNAQGKSVFKNNLPGLEAGLVGLRVLPAGATVDWVHDQVFGTGKPASVDVRVGEGAPLPPGLPEVRVSPPQVTVDPVSGVEARGTVTNLAGEEQRNVLLLAVARKGDRVIAAGRGLIDRLKATKPAHYTIFFIGDPTGAEVEVESFPLNPLKEEQ